jgi:hypothetical protein
MFFTPDEQEKTVKIPIQVRASQIQFYFDGPLPAASQPRRPCLSPVKREPDENHQTL